MSHTNHALKQISKETERLDAVAREAVAQAIERHRRLGESIAVWRVGRVVVVPPEEIPPYDSPSD